MIIAAASRRPPRWVRRGGPADREMSASQRFGCHRRARRLRRTSEAATTSGDDSLVRDRIQANNAARGTRTARPIRRVGIAPAATSSYAFVRPIPAESLPPPRLAGAPVPRQPPHTTTSAGTIVPAASHDDSRVRIMNLCDTRRPGLAAARPPRTRAGRAMAPCGQRVGPAQDFAYSSTATFSRPMGHSATACAQHPDAADFLAFAVPLLGAVLQYARRWGLLELCNHQLPVIRWRPRCLPVWPRPPRAVRFSHECFRVSDDHVHVAVLGRAGAGDSEHRRTSFEVASLRILETS